MDSENIVMLGVVFIILSLIALCAYDIYQDAMITKFAIQQGLHEVNGAWVK